MSFVFLTGLSYKMPPIRNKLKNYSTEDMQHAIEAVRRGASVSSASKEYKIPRITLLYKVKGKYEINCRMGPETMLTCAEETLLVKWLLTIADAGFPATRLQLLDSVQILMEKLNRPNKFKNNRPGKKWYQCFMKRHPELTERLTQNLTKSRSEVSEEKLRKWFDEVKQYFESKNLGNVFKDPRRVYNCDESAFFLAPKGIKCLVRKGDKTTYNFISNDDKECLTCLMTANADGMLLPPMIMFSYERIPAHISNLMPQGWGIGKSESGWMTGQSFYEFIANIFYPWLVSNGIDFPVVLFVDGHSSHLTMELSDFCIQNKIELVALYPNATHILQPMDISVFHPLKSGWKRGLQRYKVANEGKKIKRENFAPLLKEVIQETITPEMIKNGFRTCGLFPLNADGVPYEKYFKNKNIATSNTHVSYPTTRNDLQFLEEKIGLEKMKIFRECNETWEGDIKDTSLYLLWQQLSSEVNAAENTVSVHENEEVRKHDIVVDQEQRITAVFEQTDVQDRTSETVIKQNMFIREKTPEKMDSTPCTSTDNATKTTVPFGEKDNLLAVPSPFKSSLFWPKPPTQPPAKRIKEKVPSVATSDQWRAYHKKKQDDKERKEKEKAERRQRKEAAKQEKENKFKETKRKQILKQRVEDKDSSDSSIDVILESEGEDDNWGEICDDGLLDIDDYVIVKYEKQYYPGNFFFLVCLLC